MRYARGDEKTPRGGAAAGASEEGDVGEARASKAGVQFIQCGWDMERVVGGAADCSGGPARQSDNGTLATANVGARVSVLPLGDDPSGRAVYVDAPCRETASVRNLGPAADVRVLEEDAAS